MWHPPDQHALHPPTQHLKGGVRDALEEVITGSADVHWYSPSLLLFCFHCRLVSPLYSPAVLLPLFFRGSSRGGGVHGVLPETVWAIGCHADRFSEAICYTNSANGDELKYTNQQAEKFLSAWLAFLKYHTTCCYGIQFSNCLTRHQFLLFTYGWLQLTLSHYIRWLNVNVVWLQHTSTEAWLVPYSIRVQTGNICFVN